jgi:hypothetical protein
VRGLGDLSPPEDDQLLESRGVPVGVGEPWWHSSAGYRAMLKPVDHDVGSYPPCDLEALKQDRRCNAVGKVRPVLTVVPGAGDPDDPRRPDGASLIDELVREGARRMLAEALAVEVDDYIARFTGERDANGRRLVVRNGSHQPRRSSPRPARSRRGHHGSTTGVSTPTPVSGPGSPRRSCPPGAARPRRSPVLAMGDGALGFWGALHEVFPTTREALLVPQDRQRARRPPEVRASRGEKGPGRDLERRRPSPRPRRREQLQGRLRGQIQQGRREDHRRPRGTPRWGFTDATHFGRAFKETFGMSPRDWRALKQGRDR